MTHTTPPISALQRLISLFGESFRSDGYDFTHGPLERGVALLAIPMVLEMSMEAVFAITDIFYVARLGSDAIAVVGLTEAVMTLVYAVAIGLGMGVTALVARRVGAGHDEGAAAVAGQTLWLGLLCALVVAAVGIFFAVDILTLMGATAAVIDSGQNYTRILLGGALTVVYIFLLNAVFRGAGLASIAMRALVLANVINLVLDPCLIFGLGPFPNLGVTGAAIATSIGRTIGVVYLLVKLTEGQVHLRLKLRHLRFDPGVMRTLVRISLGGIGQFLIATASWVALMRLVAAYGNEAIAGYTIAVRIIDFTILPAWGLSNAAATLVGQNLGARNVERAQQAVRVVMRYTVTFMLAVAAIFLLLGEQLAAVFSGDAEIIFHASECLRFISYGYGFMGVGLVLTQAFNGAGDTWTPTWINFICFWLLQLPVAWWLAAHCHFGPRGVFVAVFFAETALALVAWLQYRRGLWFRMEI
jgi:putative MATE family efflux protein